MLAIEVAAPTQRRISRTAEATMAPRKTANSGRLFTAYGRPWQMGVLVAVGDTVRDTETLLLSDKLGVNDVEAVEDTDVEDVVEGVTEADTLSEGELDSDGVIELLTDCVGDTEFEDVAVRESVELKEMVGVGVTVLDAVSDDDREEVMEGVGDTELVPLLVTELVVVPLSEIEGVIEGVNDVLPLTEMVGVTLDVSDIVGLTLGDTDVDGVTDGVTDGDAHKYDECSETHCPIPPSLTGNDPALSHSTSPTCHSPIPDPTLAPCHPASQ
jgi:hypothetical protein